MTKEIIIDVVVQTSMVESPFVALVATFDRVGPLEEIQGVEAQVQDMASITEALKDGETE